MAIFNNGNIEENIHGSKYLSCSKVFEAFAKLCMEFAPESSPQYSTINSRNRSSVHGREIYMS